MSWRVLGVGPPKLTLVGLLRMGLGLWFLFSAMTGISLAGPLDERRAFSDSQASIAYQQALEYVSLRYEFEGTVAEGMPYLLGGQTPVSDVPELLGQGQTPGEQFGIDASGLVVNVYRSIEPGARFLVLSDEVLTLVSDISSLGMYKWNAETRPLDALVPGDLLFFLDSSGSGIGGVGLYGGKESGRVRFITASARYGRVIETWLRTDGDYWKTRYAGAGRLLYIK